MTQEYSVRKKLSSKACVQVQSTTTMGSTYKVHHESWAKMSSKGMRIDLNSIENHKRSTLFRQDNYCWFYAIDKIIYI